MKRLAFCFDGTWQKLTQPHPTNVAFTAESILPLVAGDIAQVIFYDEGVGTDPREKYSGGIFGDGMMKLLANAYRFLIFNYQAGDELYVFGFSRGAFAARSFVGLISNCGILDARFAGRSVELIDLYEGRDKSDEYRQRLMAYRGAYCTRCVVVEDEDAWRTANVKGYVAGSAVPLRVAYLGVWDTVGALGIPSWFPLSDLADRKYQFHDLSLSPLVKSARHAVSIDERRVDYAPTLWDNIADLNRAIGVDPSDPRAPYQQKWFPGNHGSVGGGGDRRGLSDQALEWIWDGARTAGLEFDTSPTSRLYELRPSPLEWLTNSSAPSGWGLGDQIDRFQIRQDRVGPTELADVSVIAQRRWQAPKEILPEREAYRPGTLMGLSTALDHLAPVDFGTDLSEDFEVHVVAPGETLGKIASRYYGDAQRYPEIFKANAWKLADPDHIYIGQALRIPKSGMKDGAQ